MQSTLQDYSFFHTAIIMDGNGRWATQRGLPRGEGHREGAKAVRRVVEAAPGLGVSVLTLYAFSSDNWRRPEGEVKQLMSLLYEFFQNEKENCIANGVRLSVIGRRDRLSLVLRSAISAAENATRWGGALHLRIAVDYSSRDSILRAISLSERRDLTREDFSGLLGKANNLDDRAPDVDLLIRTGGEQRLSDYLLWESAYAELFFTQRMWPDFDKSDLEEAMSAFHHRERRFGAAPAQAAR
ncbi:MAG: di-trans,poly-cis-decaprenylcistransferase [Candidatus Omnitrophica bacterium]|nr:di-trans,poly-cis-decaprenylcistransferase [Candidatus Omnitrophota bacterium]